MNDEKDSITTEDREHEDREWLESLDYVYENQGPDRVVSLLQRLQISAQEKGIQLPFTANTPYINTIPLEDQPGFPGNRSLERRINFFGDGYSYISFASKVYILASCKVTALQFVYN